MAKRKKTVPTETNAKAIKRNSARLAKLSGLWFAGCESGHGLWLGPERDSFAAANADAEAHNAAEHDGFPSAVVINV